jgi:hypothetical protein
MMPEKERLPLEEVIHTLVEVELEYGPDSEGYEAINEALSRLSIDLPDQVPALIERFTSARLGRP